jgi:hypothetical protein
LIVEATTTESNGTIQTGSGYAIQLSGTTITSGSLSSGGGVAITGTTITVNGNVLGSDGPVDLESSGGLLQIRVFLNKSTKTLIDYLRCHFMGRRIR